MGESFLNFFLGVGDLTGEVSADLADEMGVGLVAVLCSGGGAAWLISGLAADVVGGGVEEGGTLAL